MHGHCGQRQLNGDAMLQSIGAITLATHNMASAVAFYQALGFALKLGGPDAGSTSAGQGRSGGSDTKGFEDIRFCVLWEAFPDVIKQTPS
jgi:hypothetical protein